MKRLFFAALAGLTVFASCKEDEGKVFDLPESISIAEGETINMLLGQTMDLHLKCAPEDAWSPMRTWSATGAVTVSKFGTVSAFAEGEGIVTATCDKDNSIKASCRVIVRAIQGTEIKIDKKDYEIVIGDILKLNPKVLPDSASYQSVKYTSTNESVAIIDKGEIKGIGVGKCKIEITNQEGIKAVCNLEVKPVKVTDITLKASAEQGITLKKGESFAVEFNIVPDNATNKSLNWSSSDATIASVKDGVVTGVAAGTATITVKSEGEGKFSKSFNVTVTE